VITMMKASGQRCAGLVVICSPGVMLLQCWPLSMSEIHVHVSRAEPHRAVSSGAHLTDSSAHTGPTGKNLRSSPPEQRSGLSMTVPQPKSRQ